jgi:hypothetical protein
MRLVVKAAFVAGVLWVASIGTAGADMCFQDGNGSFLLGDSFTLPSKQACKAFNGYTPFFDSVVNGTACGTSDGSKIRFSLQFSSAPQTFPTLFFALMELNRTSLTGSIQYCDVQQTTCNGVISVAKIPCTSSMTLP